MEVVEIHRTRLRAFAVQDVRGGVREASAKSQDPEPYTQHPQHERSLRGKARCDPRFVDKTLPLNPDQHPHAKGDQHQLEIEQRIRERLGRVGNQEECPGDHIEPEADPDKTEESAERDERQLRHETQKARAQQPARADEQGETDVVEDQDEVVREQRLRLAEPGAQTGALERVQKRGCQGYLMFS